MAKSNSGPQSIREIAHVQNLGSTCTGSLDGSRSTRPANQTVPEHCNIINTTSDRCRCVWQHDVTQQNERDRSHAQDDKTSGGHDLHASMSLCHLCRRSIGQRASTCSSSCHTYDLRYCTYSVQSQICPHPNTEQTNWKSQEWVQEVAEV